MSMDSILKDMNEQQRKAVTTVDGPVLVLAGAGSGKTRVLTHRVAYLTDEMQVSPYHILALTFTNKAAGEMRDRIRNLVNERADDMWIMTFHSCCCRILRMDIDRIGYDPKFVIYDDSDQQSVVKRIIKDLRLNDKIYTPRVLLSRFSDAKNHSLNPLQYFKEAYEQQPVIDAYLAYQKALRQSNALDFDDLLLKTLELFEKAPDVLEKYQNRFRYILVDEYQDTNMAQYHIVRLLAMRHRNICVVGDDDQSIYGWRGADIRNILGFEKDFPGATVIRLEQNYRSTEQILNAGNAVIKNNHGRKGKTMWTAQKGGAPLEFREVEDERSEAIFICGDILSSVRSGRRYQDHAILYRTNAQSRVLEMYLKSYSIPYRVYGGISFFQRAEIKDVLAYLRLMQNPQDDIAFQRAVSTPKRGIGDTSIGQLQAAAREQGLSSFSALLAGAEFLPQKLLAKFQPFTDMVMEIYASIGVVPLADSIRLLLERTGYEAYLRASTPDAVETKLEVLEEFISYASQFEQELGDGEHDVLSEFLETVALFTSGDNADESDAVSMMTLHGAKGLEFPVVYLTGMEDGLFPSVKGAQLDDEKLEEERRLCYVGITRAMQRLVFTRARQRLVYGTVTPSPASRFLEELGDLIPVEGTTLDKGRSGSRTGNGHTTDWAGAFAASGNGYVPRRASPAPSASRPAVRTGAANAVKAAPPASPRHAPIELSVGMRISHNAFGNGTVESLSGSGTGRIVEIAFDSGITKKFAADYAPLSKLED